VRDAAKLTNFRFHDLRHTTGSYLAMSGATEREIMEVLGHRTAVMARRYSHLSPHHVAGVVERMVDKFI
jgi:integrase